MAYCVPIDPCGAIDIGGVVASPRTAHARGCHVGPPVNVRDRKRATRITIRAR